MFGGIKSLKNKKLTIDKKIVELPSKKYVKIALLQGIGDESIPVVKNGDYVKKGTLIGKGDKTRFSSNIFSSVSGKVIDIISDKSIIGKGCKQIIIENDNLEEEELLPNINKNREEILNRIFDAGIVGLGGAGFPTYFKLNTSSVIKAVIINGAECEDYLNADNALLNEKLEEVLLGAKYIGIAVNCEKIVLCVMKFKKKLIKNIKNYIKSNNLSNVELKLVPNKYPIGAEKILIKEVFNKELKLNELPTNENVVVDNVSTCFAIYNAVDKNIPLYSRVITVSGKAVKNCGNYLVRIGTMLDDLYSLCGGEVYPLKELEDFKHNAYDGLGELDEMKQDLKNEKDQAKILVLKENIKKKQKESNNMIFKYLKENQKNFNSVLAKIVNGGSFLGNCLEDFNYTICKPTTAILFMSNSEVNFMESETCIHCGKCQKVCPMKLVPYEIYENKDNIELCKKKDVMSCLECGCCSYICPAKLSLTTTFVDIKKQIKQNNSNVMEKKDGNK